MKVMITGHRPDKLGGYARPNPTEHWVRINLRALLTKLKAKDPDLEGVTGMALGADQIFAEVCVELGVPFTAALPFRGQEGRWPPESQQVFRRLLARARAIVVVDEIPEYQSDSIGAKMALRNNWMVANSDKAVAVWDGSEGGTANAVKELLRRGRKIARLDPRTQKLTVEQPPNEGPTVFDLFGT